MKQLASWNLAMAISLLAVMATACSGRATVAVETPQVVVTETVPVVTCTEEWVHMPVLIGFPTGGAIIDEQNRAILREVVRTAQARTDIRRVRVEGHTDTCGREVGNMMLSEQRATAVAQELVSMGAPADRIETIGYGSERPRADEDCTNRETRQSTALSRQTNRRVEFSILVCQNVGGATTTTTTTSTTVGVGVTAPSAPTSVGVTVR